MLRFYFNEVISVQLQYNCKYRLSWHWVTGWSFSEGEDYDLKRYVSHLTQGKWERRHTMKKKQDARQSKAKKKSGDAKHKVPGQVEAWGYLHAH